MSGKQLLHRDVELCKWWVSVSHDPRFDQLLVCATAELSDTCTSFEHLKGAKDALNLLLTITDNAAEFHVFPTSGLDHRSLEEIAKRPTLTPNDQPKA